MKNKPFACIPKSGMKRKCPAGYIATPATDDAFLIRSYQRVQYQADETSSWLYYWGGYNGTEAEKLTRQCGYTDNPIRQMPGWNTCFTRSQAQGVPTLPRSTLCSACCIRPSPCLLKITLRATKVYLLIMYTPQPLYSAASVLRHPVCAARSQTMSASVDPICTECLNEQ